MYRSLTVLLLLLLWVPAVGQSTVSKEPATITTTVSVAIADHVLSETSTTKDGKEVGIVTVEGGKPLVRAYRIQAASFQPPVFLKWIGNNKYALTDSGKWIVEVLTPIDAAPFWSAEYLEIELGDSVTPEVPPTTDWAKLYEYVKTHPVVAADRPRAVAYGDKLSAIDLSGEASIQDAAKKIQAIRAEVFVGRIMVEWNAVFQSASSELGKAQTVTEYIAGVKAYAKGLIDGGGR